MERPSATLITRKISDELKKEKIAGKLFVMKWQAYLIPVITLTHYISRTVPEAIVWNFRRLCYLPLHLICLFLAGLLLLIEDLLSNRATHPAMPVDDKPISNTVSGKL